MLASRAWLMAAALAVAPLVPVGGGAAPQWELLGSRVVSFAGERDAIEVGAREGPFTAIRLEVDGGNLEMYDVRVVLGDGQVWSPNTRVRFREGSWSRTLDLPGRARVIRRVEFRYRSEVRRGRATIRVYGRSNAPAPPPVSRSEWDRLGTRRVNFAAERDVIEVGPREGRFTAIRIEVEGGNLEMYDVRIVFGDGAAWSPTTRLTFREGSWSRNLDLPGAARVIRRIEFRYRSQLRRGQATVHVYGRAAATAPTSRTGPPAPSGWDHVGTREVSVRADHDVITALGRGAFRRLRVDVEGGALEMRDIRVTFANGSSFSPLTRLVFNANTRSRVIDLPGAARVIRRIDFSYRSLERRPLGRVTVHVYGRR